MMEIFKKPDIHDDEIVQALNRREMRVERNINYFRAAFLVFVLSANLFSTFSQTTAFNLKVFVSLFSILSIGFSVAIHIYSGKSKFYPYLKYFAVTADFGMTFLFVYSNLFIFNHSNNQPFEIYLIVNLSNLLFFNVLSLLRSKRGIVIYSGFMAMLVNTILFAKISFYAEPFWFATVYIVIFTVFNLWAARHILNSFIATEKLKLANQKITRHSQQIEAQKEEIRQYSANITDSIHYAKRIQSAAIPETRALSGYFAEHFVFFRPKDIVSGDFYWFKNFDKTIWVAAADCTGHGVPGAFMSMLGISLLNDLVNKKSDNAARLLDQLRAKIKESLRQIDSSSEQKDGMDMALMRFDFDGRTVDFAGANSNLMLVRNAQMTLIKGDKMPVGVYQIEKSFTNQRISFNKSDVFYAASDGLADQFGGDKGRKFMSANFRQLLQKNAHLPLSAQHQIIEETINLWMNPKDNPRTYEQLDDMLVVGLKI